MAVPISSLQKMSNNSILEFFSVELKPDIHYTKIAKTGQFAQSGFDITITLNNHGFDVGLILSLVFTNTSGSAIDGVYTIQSKTTNTFTVKGIVSQTGAGSVNFNVNTNLAEPTVYLFHSGNNIKDFNDIVWQSNTYNRMPCKSEGYKLSGKGKLPRPTLTLTNLLKTITGILLLVNKVTPLSDLAGAKVTRRQALSKDLDEINFPNNTNPFKINNVDPSAELPREVYFIERKVTENRDIVEFELVSTFDLIGIGAPKKLVTRADFPLVGTLTNA